MKKLYIGLILLSLFSFLPQFANADVIMPPKGVLMMRFAYEAGTGFLIVLIITSILKGICGIPFGKKFCYLVLITNLISISLLFVSFLYFAVWHSDLLRSIDSPLVLVLILTIIPLEWVIFSIFSKIKHLKLLKSFLFALLSNIIAYGLGFYLFLHLIGHI